MDLRRAWWWALDYAWAGLVWLSTPFAPPPERYSTGTGRTVVALPGVYEDWRFLRPLIAPLHDRGHAVHVVTDLGHTRAPIAEGAAAVLHLLADRDLRDVVIVAHSKGGLIGKLALSEDVDGRISDVVAICTPFGGSSLAHLLPLRSLRPLVPGHSSLTALSTLAGVNAQVTSIYGPWDEHVPEGSELEGACNVRVDVPGHFRPLGHPAVLAEVLKVVESPAYPPSSRA